MTKPKALVQGALEALASIALVLVCFLAFTVLLFASFPAGSELGEMFNSVGMPTGTGAVSLNVNVSGRSAWRDLVASVSSVQRSVKTRPSDSIAWMDARAGLALASQDAVQTFTQSVATIAFASPNELRVGENSMVVVRESQRDEETKHMRASVVLVHGELRGTVDPSGTQAMDLNVVVGPATARLVSPAGGHTRFRIAATANRPSIVSVFAGGAEVTSGAQTVSFGANMYVSIDSDGAISDPKPLPPIPHPISPAVGEARRFRRAETEVHFTWSQRERPDGYHLTVASDPGFERIAYEGRPRSTEFVHGHLKAGRYYWRVSAFRSGAESDFSPARSLDLTSDAHAPKLHVEFPETDPDTQQIVLRGESEPGVTVFVAGRSVSADAKGRFEVPVDLQRGVNVLVVEAMDAAGNFAYASRMVTAKFEITKRSS